MTDPRYAVEDGNPDTAITDDGLSTATADAELLEGLKRIQVFCEGLR